MATFVESGYVQDPATGAGVNGARVRVYQRNADGSRGTNYVETTTNAQGYYNITINTATLPTAAGKGYEIEFYNNANPSQLRILRTDGEIQLKKVYGHEDAYGVIVAPLPDGGITTVMLADANPAQGRGITTAKIVDANVTTAKLADGAVTTAKLADNAVTSTKIGTGAVINAKIADGAVTSVKIADGNVTTVKLADTNVTSAKIADGAVTNPKIATGAVASDKIADGNVITQKLADGAVNDTKLGNRTITDTAAPASDTAPLTTLLSNLGYMVKAITGKSNWRTNPVTSIEAINSRINFVENKAFHLGKVSYTGNGAANRTITFNSDGVIPVGVIIIVFIFELNNDKSVFVVLGDATPHPGTGILVNPTTTTVQSIADSTAGHISVAAPGMTLNTGGNAGVGANFSGSNYYAICFYYN
jgi:hypothetical protein